VATSSEIEITPARMLLYSMSGFGLGCADFIVAVYLLKYYTDHLALSATLAGIALMLGKLLDGVSDPIMGFISDRTRTRWGRRRPWFLVGAAPFALSFIAMFSAEAGWSQLQLFLWLLSWNVIFWSAQTVINVPNAALAGEMVEQHDERNAIMGWREGMWQLGLLVGAAAPLLVLNSMQDAAVAAALAAGMSEQAARAVGFAARGEAHGVMAWQFASLVFVGVLLAFFGTREPSRPRTPPRESIFGDFADTLKSRPFRLFIAIFLFDQIASGLTATLVLYTIRDWWQFTGRHEMFLIMAYLLAAVASIPIWVRVGRRMEKVQIFAIGSFLSAATLLGATLVPHYGLSLAYAGLIGSGVGLGARAVMAMSTVPDIIDDDEVRTHTRKDGAYIGMWSLTRKLARALSIGAAGLGLSFWGYQEGALEQPESAIRGIMWMFSIIPAMAATVCGFLFLRFPITRAIHEATLEELDRRRASPPEPAPVGNST
jgi:GPH family glycoside/pentoside/hexuronide:cation symporter